MPTRRWRGSSAATTSRCCSPISGLQLAGEVHRRWPAIRILLTSGDTRPTGAAIPDDGRFLAKPYRFEALSRELDQLLAH